MRIILVSSAMALMCVAGNSLAQDAKAPTPAHVLVRAADLKWGDPPPVFAKGASFTVVSGDPGKAGLYVVRLKMPAGYKIAPHWHPGDEHVTVISGVVALGMGDKFDKSAMKTLPAGSYALLPAEMRHFVMVKTAATVQVHGMGPFALTYVDPNDDPSKRTPKK